MENDAQSVQIIECNNNNFIEVIPNNDNYRLLGGTRYEALLEEIRTWYPDLYVDAMSLYEKYNVGSITVGEGMTPEWCHATNLEPDLLSSYGDVLSGLNKAICLGVKIEETAPPMSYSELMKGSVK